MELCITQIPIEEIDVPAGQREVGNLDGLMDSIRTVGLLNAIRVIPDGAKYRVIAGVRRYLAYQRLGWPTIPAIIEEMDDLHAELATIDENLIRQELTALEHAEQLARRKEIYEALHPETKQGKGPGRGHREKKRNHFASFADDTASKVGYYPRTIQQAVQIANDLSNSVRERIRALPIAHKTSDLLCLARLPRETQEAIADQLASGSATSLREAQRAVNADAEDRQSTSSRRPSPPVQTSAPQSTGVERDGEEQDTLLQTVVAHFQQFSAIHEGQIAGRPAAEVMAERLAALRRPELVLLSALVEGQAQEAAASWLAAVRADVQNGVAPFDGMQRREGHRSTADTTDEPRASGNDQADGSGVMITVRGDDAEVQAARDQGSASTGDPAAANVPTAARAAPPPPCESCGSPKTWHIYGAPADRFACLACQHHFTLSTPGAGPSIGSLVSSHATL